MIRRIVKVIPERQKEIKRRIRAKNRLMSDLQALWEVQEQFDDLIKQMVTVKTALAGLIIGESEVSVEWE